jgi:hypothetical protein
MYFVRYCFICRLSDSFVSEDAGIEPRTVAWFDPSILRHSGITLHRSLLIQRQNILYPMKKYRPFMIP